MIRPLDKLGTPVEIGSIIVYGHALGRCAALRVGRVLELNQVPRPYWYGTGPAPATWHATVIGIADEWNGRPAALNEKVGTLQFPDRWVVLTPAQVPVVYRELLASFVWPREKKVARPRKRG
jgi:hypothetical protein